jgi:hypothetical protein
MASTSPIVRAEACATSTSMCRASMRRTISRPVSVRPVWSAPADIVIEEVRGCDHADAGVIEAIDVGEVAIERLCAFHAKKSRSDFGIVMAAIEVGAQSGGGADDGELAVRPRLQAAQSRSLIQGALGENCFTWRWANAPRWKAA